MTDRINNVGPKKPRVNDVGPKQPKVSHEEAMTIGMNWQGLLVIIAVVAWTAVNVHQKIEHEVEMSWLAATAPATVLLGLMLLCGAINYFADRREKQDKGDE